MNSGGRNLSNDLRGEQQDAGEEQLCVHVSYQLVQLLQIKLGRIVMMTVSK